MMLNASDVPPLDPTAEAAAIEGDRPRRSVGAIALAGTATAIVIALWFVFFFIVFLPRGAIQ